MKIRFYRGKWQADYSDQFGKRHRRSFETKRQATEHLVEAKAAIIGGSFRSEASKTTVALVAHEFIQECRDRVDADQLDGATAHNYIGHTERYILGTRDLWAPRRADMKGVFFERPLGRLRLSDVDGSVLDDFRSALYRNGLSKGTVRLVLVAVSRVFERAKRRKLITQNPVKENPAPKSTRGDQEVEIPSKDVVKRLLGHTSDYGELLIMFAAATGLRAGEQRGLRWRDTDLEKREVHVRRTVNRFGQVGPPKTKAGRRTVPIPEPLARRLREHLERSTLAELDDLVFPGAEGKPVHHTTWIKSIYNVAWDNLRASPGGANVRRCKWHALRHFAISTWIEKGVPVKRVQRWAGHTTPQITLNTYTHLFEVEDHSDAIDQIGADLFGDS